MRRFTLAVLLVLAGCGGEEAAPGGVAPGQEAVAQEAGPEAVDQGAARQGDQAAPARPLISVETPVRSPGALGEVDPPAGPSLGAGREDAPAVEIPQPSPIPEEPEPAVEPAAEPGRAEPPPAPVAAASPPALLAVLPVRDLEAAEAFYRDGLGFTRASGGVSGEVVLERGGTRLALRRTDEGKAPRAGASGWNVPRSGLVLRLEVDDLAAVRERLSGAGLAPRRARGGGLAVLDPAGHLVVVSGS
jgi:catechol 2,3-dioxygenase-like lactoylglutathione lyase family enzyme